MLCFVLIDLTTTATPSELRPTPAILTEIAAALQEQIDGEWQEAWDTLAIVRVGSGPDDRDPDEIAIHLRDAIPEAPGALAYHTVTNGIPDIEIGVDLFTSLTEGLDSVSAGGSHEVLETLGDVGANGWKDKGAGIMGAEEVADPVQNTCYPTKTGPTVSNFVLPSYFIPGSAGPWDHLGVMKTQDDISNGYEIQAPSPTDVSQAAKDFARDGLPIRGTIRNPNVKKHPHSRTYRRGVRLP
jgi:hypothetical protein